MTRPRLLDLFCGAGGASKGYADAGFEVVGVDLTPQPNYPFEFYRADALTFSLDGFDAIHASPPCQQHSSIGKQIRGRFDHIEHADHIEAVRARLTASGSPYVIENVVGAPLLGPITLCGSSFGLNVRRHRLFESNVPIMSLPCAHYWQAPRFRSLDKRHPGMACVVGVHGHLNYAGESPVREAAMGVDWMTPYELTQAIPPAYTQHVGYYLMLEVNARRECAA